MYKTTLESDFNQSLTEKFRTYCCKLQAIAEQIHQDSSDATFFAFHHPTLI
jgi:hypothetical protein